MLTLTDLDFENITDLREKLHARDTVEAIADIRKTRKSLGGMTVRDTVEAIYGEAYANQILGEDGGNDILVEELTHASDLLESQGKDRLDIGGNRMAANKIPKKDATKIRKILEDQEAVIDKGIQDSVDRFYDGDAKALKNQTPAIDLDNMLVEDKDELIKLLLAQKQRRG